MSASFPRRLFGCGPLVFFLAAICAPLSAQTITSALSGRIEDQTGAVVPNAKITVVSENSRTERTTVTNSEGLFAVPGLLPDTYTVRVESPAFVASVVTGVHLSTNQDVSMGVIQLRVGMAQQAVTVQSQADTVQTVDSQRSELVTGQEINQIALRGRDVFDLFRMLPGVADLGGSRDAPAPAGYGNIYVNGARATQRAVWFDGVSLNNSGSYSIAQLDPSMEAVAEMQVIDSTQLAEYGRNGNSTLNIISKGGGRDFHGVAAWYFRNTDLNANNFFNNRANEPRSDYRFNIGNFAIGGPIYIPHRLNVDRNKLFFFFSEQVQRQILDYGPSFIRVPSALERQGNFSQSFQTNGQLITITDPLSGAPFPNNIVPPARINNSGQAILNFFPAQNWAAPTAALGYQYNYYSDYGGTYPRREEFYRVDYAPSPTLNTFVRFVADADSLQSPYGTFSGTPNFPKIIDVYNNPAVQLAAHVLKTSSPTLVHDITFGFVLRHANYDVQNPDLLNINKLGITFQPLFPETGKWEPPYMPTVTFGGVPNAVAAGNPSYPGITYNPSYTGAYNMTKVWGSHNIKVGVYYEHTYGQQYVANNWRGAIDFSQNTTNPLDSGYAYANAILGNFLSYSDSNGRTEGQYTFTNVEYYAQDKWRVTPRLTLDYGLRMYNLPTLYDALNNNSAFYLSQYNPAQAPLLLYPGFNNGQRAAVNPATGATYPAAYIGAFAPGVGNPADGFVRAGTSGFPQALHSEPSWNAAPRFGFAYDVTGHAKTVLRGGFGMFYDRVEGNVSYNMSGQLPVLSTYQIWDGNLNTISQSGGFLFPPASTITVPLHNKIPSSMSYNIGIQHDLGAGVIVDAAYVGSLGRHLVGDLCLNCAAPGADFLAANQDPTRPGAPLAAAFLRPLNSTGQVWMEDYSLTQNYNALQVSVTRRFTSRLFFGANWTWAHTLGTLGSDFAQQSPYFPTRERDYGPLPYDERHVLVVHWVYELPGLPSSTQNKVLHGMLDHWQFAGVPEFVSGLPATPTFTVTNGETISGSPDVTPRIEVAGNPILPKGARSFGENFNPAAFALPAVGTLGNGGVGILRQPGINNWDLSIYKRWPWGKSEGRYVQLRTEFYNAFNHTQFQTINTGAIFNPAGAEVNTQFGAFTAARDPRRIQFALKIVF